MANKQLFFYCEVLNEYSEINIKNIASLATIEVVNQICLVILALLIPLYLGDVGLDSIV